MDCNLYFNDKAIELITIISLIVIVYMIAKQGLDFFFQQNITILGCNENLSATPICR